jgi:maltokinase
MSSTPRDRFPGLALLADPRAVVGDGAVAELVVRWHRAATTGVPLAPGVRALVQDDRAMSDLAAVDDVTPEAQVSSDHANLSIAVGDVLVKFLADPAPGEDHGLTLMRHLAAVDAAVVPRWIGALVAGERVLAIATRYLGVADEGWSRYRDLARAVLDGRDARDTSLDAARAAGDAVARFHLAVATPSVVFDTPVGRAGPEEVAAWRARADATIAAAGRAVASGHRDRVARIARRSADEWQAFDAAVGTPVIRIHGDLHVGQLLTVQDAVLVTDLDGDPSLPAHERDRPAPPARDLAALLRSLDHAGRLAALRSGTVALDAAEVDAWVTAVRGAAVLGYRATLAGAGHDELLAGELVAGFETAQLAHELHYAATRLPDWLPVAAAAADAWLDRRITDAT